MALTLRWVVTAAVRLRLLWLVLVVPLVFAPGASAQPLERERIPPVLQPWIPWVLDGAGDVVCATVDGKPNCVWPGRLELVIEKGGGEFALEVTLDRELAVPLPGGRAQWPLQVTVRGEPQVVQDQQGTPHVVLPAGEHRIEGRFEWDSMPESIAVPAGVAQVTLRLLGSEVPLPRRSDDGSVWLESTSRAEAGPERLEISVHRLIEDGVPVTVTTELLLRVSGRARQQDFGRVLLPQSTPLRIESPLPAKLDEQGRLAVQLRGGEHRVRVVARIAEPVGTLRAPKAATPWPERETWAFQPAPKVRQVEIEGGQPIDPARTELPKEWKEQRAFVIVSGESLKLETTRRGQPDPPPDQVKLSRTMWLDLDGGGFTVRDQLTGTLEQDFRMDLMAAKLGRAEVAGEPWVITQAPDGTGYGVELRRGELNLHGEWRLTRDSWSVPAVGWSEDVEQLDARLELPPGWSLFAATGVDRASGAWVASWNLFEFFFVLLVALAIAKLTRPVWGVVALAGLVLSHEQASAPYFVWIALIVFLALLKVARGWLRSMARLGGAIAGLALLVSLIVFSTNQMRTALYPQTERAGVSSSITLDTQQEKLVVNQPPPVARPKPAREQSGQAAGGRLEQDRAGRFKQGLPAEETEFARGDTSFASKKSQGWQAADLLVQDPDATVQTGPGVPNWGFQTIRLNWDGPVQREQPMSLYLLSPTVNALLALARVALLVALGLLLLKVLLRSWDRSPNGGQGPPSDEARVGIATVVAFLLPRLLACVAAGLLLTHAPPARAEVPPAEVLEELKSRLTRPDECGESCIDVPKLNLEVSGTKLRIRSDVHAAGNAGYKLPGPAASWIPRAVRVDGQPSSAFVLRDDGYLYLRLERGRHQVELEGPVASNDLALELGARPHRVEVSAAGWDVAGLREDGTVEGGLRLSRTASPDGTPEEAMPSTNRLPPWLQVQREVVLGARWRIVTTLRRVSPVGDPIVVQMPLLPGEEVVDANIETKQGLAEIAFTPTEESKSYTSSITPREELVLTAPEGRPWTERWLIDCGVMWHCEHSGLPPVERKMNDILRPEFLPWPGEKLTLSVQKPVPAKGASLTIERALLMVTPGARLTSAVLTLTLRSSRGEAHQILLPAKAKIQELSVNGTAAAVRKDGRELTIPLLTPSQNVTVRWQEPTGLSAGYSAPQVDLRAPVTNTHVSVELPRDRWLVWTSGPAWGPAILWWGYALLILVGAFIAARVPMSPLRAWQWALLGLGLTQIPAAALLVVVGWFFAMAWRGRRLSRSSLAHDATQLVLVGWTLAALACLVVGVYQGLVGSPDMEVQGAGSTNSMLHYLGGRSDGALPVPWILSLPLWVWQLLTLAWALWLAWSLVRWSRWGLAQFLAGGAWRSLGIVKAFSPKGAKPVGQPAGAATPQSHQPPAPPAENRPE